MVTASHNTKEYNRYKYGKLATHVCAVLLV
jgi:phosphomannomutase